MYENYYVFITHKNAPPELTGSLKEGTGGEGIADDMDLVTHH